MGTACARGNGTRPRRGSDLWQGHAQDAQELGAQLLEVCANLAGVHNGVEDLADDAMLGRLGMGVGALLLGLPPETSPTNIGFHLWSGFR